MFICPTESIQQLGQVWKWVLTSVADRWLYNCDSDDSHAFCCRAIHDVGPWRVIYQPAGVGYCRMLEERCIGNVIIKRRDNRPITRAMWASAQDTINQINKQFLQSYNDILDVTNGHWFLECDGTLDSLLHTVKPLHLENGLLKLKFAISTRYCNQGWIPRRIIEEGSATGSICLDGYTVEAQRASV
jgi:hypothetical protein